MTKRKKRDPLASLKKRHPGKWQVSAQRSGTYVVYCGEQWLVETPYRTLARTIAKLGAK